VQAHGAWIRLTRTTTGGTATTEGELIAIATDTVFVLTSLSEPGHLDAVPKRDISDGKLGHYDPDTGILVGWTLLGIPSTISHGFFLVLTAPMWMLGGWGATLGHSSTAIEGIAPYEIGQWESLKLYARFPQGMPDGIDRSTLMPRSIRER
jgi:hypothetical protein